MVTGSVEPVYLSLGRAFDVIMLNLRAAGHSSKLIKVTSHVPLQLTALPLAQCGLLQGFLMCAGCGLDDHLESVTASNGEGVTLDQAQPGAATTVLLALAPGPQARFAMGCDLAQAQETVRCCLASLIGRLCSAGQQTQAGRVLGCLAAEGQVPHGLLTFPERILLLEQADPARPETVARKQQMVRLSAERAPALPVAALTPSWTCLQPAMIHTALEELWAIQDGSSAFTCLQLPRPGADHAPGIVSEARKQRPGGLDVSAFACLSARLLPARSLTCSLARLLACLLAGWPPPSRACLLLVCCLAAAADALVLLQQEMSRLLCERPLNDAYHWTIDPSLVQPDPQISLMLKIAQQAPLQASAAVARVMLLNCPHLSHLLQVAGQLQLVKLLAGSCVDSVLVEMCHAYATGESAGAGAESCCSFALLKWGLACMQTCVAWRPTPRVPPFSRSCSAACLAPSGRMRLTMVWSSATRPRPSRPL